MPITWSEADVSPTTLAEVPESASFSWQEFSVAYELYLLNGKASRYEIDEIFNDYFKD